MERGMGTHPQEMYRTYILDTVNIRNVKESERPNEKTKDVEYKRFHLKNKN